VLRLPSRQPAVSFAGQAQALCATSRALDTLVAERTGLDRGSVAGHIPGGVARMGGLSDPHDID
jgi:hypothetical protein